MAQTRFKVEDGLLVRGQANITGNTVIAGTLELQANVVTGINANGNVTPVSNNEFNLGSSNFRWLRVFANSGTFSNTVEVTGQANLYGGVHLRSHLTFDTNSHSVGNTTAMPSALHTQNTFVYNTLTVAGVSGAAYLVANSSTVLTGSNLAVNGSKISIKSDTVGIIAANTNALTISTNVNAPTTIHEFSTITGISVAKYFIYCKNLTTNETQVSEIVVMFNDVDSNVNIGEYNIMHSGAAPFVSYSAYKDDNANLVRLTAHCTHASIDITMQITTLV